MRPSWIEIDLEAIEHNVREISGAIGNAEVCAVVKADGYGHGDVPVAEAALRGGATWIAVALVEEGIRLREADIDVPILLLSEPRLTEAREVVSHVLTPTVYTMEFLGELTQAATEASSTPYSVHLKIDTGMHRVGAPPIAAFEVARAVEQNKALDLQGVFTHFSVSDTDTEYTMRQNTALERFVEVLVAEGIRPPIVHAANTAAALSLPETRHTLCRVGLGIYGLYPAPRSQTDVSLLPAMRVVSHVVHTLDLPNGARPSYGRRRQLSSPGRVATVPIGYADGVRRGLTDSGTALINGVRYPFAGTISMDMLVVDVGSDDVNVGDEVVLMGGQGDEVITAEQWAELLDTITWEIVCGFGPRLPRRHTTGTTDDE